MKQEDQPLRQNNITAIIGIAFAIAAVGNDYQKSGLSLGDYVSQKATSAAQIVVDAADVLTPKNLTPAQMQGLAAGVAAPK